jgi:hypothetical protein
VRTGRPLSDNGHDVGVHVHVGHPAREIPHRPIVPRLDLACEPGGGQLLEDVLGLMSLKSDSSRRVQPHRKVRVRKSRLLRTLVFV